jgi:hypothetical protein
MSNHTEEVNLFRDPIEVILENYRKKRLNEMNKEIN